MEVISANNSILATFLSNLILCCLMTVRLTTAESLASNSLELNRPGRRLHPSDPSLSNDLDYVWFDSEDEEDTNASRRRNSQRKSRLRYNNFVPDYSSSSQRRSRYRAGATSETLIIQAEPEFNTGKLNCLISL